MKIASDPNHPYYNRHYTMFAVMKDCREIVDVCAADDKANTYVTAYMEGGTMRYREHHADIEIVLRVK